MKVFLMHRDRDYDLRQKFPPHESDLTQDLELNTLLSAMAEEDDFVFDVTRHVLFSGLQNDMDTIQYRQAILKDCLQNPTVVRSLYDLTTETLTGKRRHWLGIFSRSPSAVLYDSILMMELFADRLKKVRILAETHAGRFLSEGFTSLFSMIIRELGDDYLADIRNHLTELKFNKGLLLSAALNDSNGGTDYVLRLDKKPRSGWIRRTIRQEKRGYSFRLDERDETGAKILSVIRDKGINLTANALAQSADHVLSFFRLLRTELAFYIGCLNLHKRLTSKGETICFPCPSPAGTRRCRCCGLYDVSLSLHMEHPIVSNTIDADGKNRAIITGANQGGKSVFLRSIGLAQMMMHSGMFVAAESYHAELCSGLFTHYKREEDVTMTGGKFDEEMGRLSDIADELTPNAMLLCNESFSATNQREGSEIAGQVMQALLHKHIKVFFVTHLYEFARKAWQNKTDGDLFLRAERRNDGKRTFRLIEGEPSETSYGEDLYREIFRNETKNLSVL